MVLQFFPFWICHCEARLVEWFYDFAFERWKLPSHSRIIIAICPLRLEISDAFSELSVKF